MTVRIEPTTEPIASITDTTCHHSDSYAADKTKLLSRLARVEGQIRGVARMVEDDRYCVDILTQISAINSSMQSIGLLLLEDHIRGCVVGAEGDQLETRLDELNKAIARFTRSVG
jgi:DNA-binding FrmR family transcriptional regulator